jgi:hypothetical protein
LTCCLRMSKAAAAAAAAAATATAAAAAQGVAIPCSRSAPYFAHVFPVGSELQCWWGQRCGLFFSAQPYFAAPRWEQQHQRGTQPQPRGRCRAQSTWLSLCPLGLLGWHKNCSLSRGWRCECCCCRGGALGRQQPWRRRWWQRGQPTSEGRGLWAIKR